MESSHNAIFIKYTWAKPMYRNKISDLQLSWDAILLFFFGALEATTQKTQHRKQNLQKKLFGYCAKPY